MLIAWLALTFAFTMFIGRPGIIAAPVVAGTLAAVCALTAGVGFIAHELAHKVVAVHYRRPAAFRADYSLLFLTVMSGLAGFLFAAPGAVHHRGRPDRRVHGHVALAGPLTNVALAIGFLPLTVVPIGIVATLGTFGVWINVLLAAFNMLPFGPLDGKTVWRWHRGVFIAVFVPCVVAAFLVFTTVGLIPL